MTETTVDPSAAPPAAPPVQSWFEGDWLPPDLRDHAAAKGWSKAADAQSAFVEAAKAHRAAESRLGAPADKLLRLPDQMDGEWWSKHKATLGVPETPEGYQIERPQMPQGLPWDERFEVEARKAFHAAGAPPHVVKAAVDFYAAQTAAAFAADQKALHGAQETLMQELQASWGASAQANTETAKTAFQTFAKLAGVEGPAAEGLAARISQAMGGDALMLRMFHKIGEAAREDGLKGGGLGAGAGALVSSADLRAEIESIRKSSEYRQNASAFAAKMEGLYKVLAAAEKRGG